MFETHGMIVTAIFWAAIVAIVFMTCFFKYRERTSRHRMIETFAEKGQPIPPELLTNGGGHAASWRYGSSVHSGIYLMCVGVAIGLFFWSMSGRDEYPLWVAFIGIFPFMIGLARVLTGILDRQPAK